MKRILIPILILGLLLIPSVASAASGVTIDKTEGDGIWTDDTWKVEIYPGEERATTLTLHNSSSSSLDVEVTIQPDSLDSGNLIFELDRATFTMPGKSYTDVTLTVKASGSATPGTYTAELEIKSEVPYRPPGGGGGGAPDTKPPRIYDVSLCSISETTADICWKTKEKSTSQVEYWTSPTELSPLDEEYVIDHRVELTDLTPGTIYYYKAMSEDRAGNLEISEEDSFTTLGEAPKPEPTPPEPEEPVIPEPTLPEPEEPMAPPEPEPEWEAPWGLIAGVIGGLAVVAGALYYWRRRAS